jgi:hypothetical protein
MHGKSGHRIAGISVNGDGVVCSDPFYLGGTVWFVTDLRGDKDHEIAADSEMDWCSSTEMRTSIYRSPLRVCGLPFHTAGARAGERLSPASVNHTAAARRRHRTADISPRKWGSRCGSDEIATASVRERATALRLGNVGDGEAGQFCRDARWRQ